MDKKIVVIIQARMGSTRLPGKVLMQLHGKSVLQHVVERVQRSKFKTEIIIATTSLQRDNVIVDEAKRIGVSEFRGSEDDVLSRYFEAAQSVKADIIVRITSDCPVIDWVLLDDMLEKFFDNPQIEYLSNTVDRTYPRGLDVEIFSFKTLEKAYKESTQKPDREHVTPYIWRQPELFSIEQYKNKKDYSRLRWTLDTQEDWELICKIYDSLYPTKKDFNFEDILKKYEDHPEWELINEHVEQKKVFNV